MRSLCMMVIFFSVVGCNSELDLLRRSAEQGDTEAQLALASELELYGNVGRQREAVKWFQKAANKNNVWALNGLAYHYLSGDGVERDCKRAADLFEQAAARGFGPSQENLVRLYLLDDSMKSDIDAYIWSVVLRRTWKKELTFRGPDNQTVGSIDELASRLSADELASAQLRIEDISSKIQASPPELSWRP